MFYIESQGIVEMVNVLPDLDGTLTNPYEGITACIEHALLALGRLSPPRAMLARHIGPPLQQAFAELLDSRDGRSSIKRSHFTASDLRE